MKFKENPEKKDFEKRIRGSQYEKLLKLGKIARILIEN